MTYTYSIQAEDVDAGVTLDLNVELAPSWLTFTNYKNGEDC